jgi:hypothetical protein
MSAVELQLIKESWKSIMRKKQLKMGLKGFARNAIYN